MEFKVILYIIGGIGYFVYTIVKARKQQAEDAAKSQSKPVANKPVQPPTANPFEEITRELKRKQAEADARRAATQQAQTRPKPVTKTKPAVKPTEVLVREKKSTVFEEGVSNYESTYEREQTAEDKIVRGNLKIENEGVYKIESITEQEAREAAEKANPSYNFNAREAIIGSIIMERKF